MSKERIFPEHVQLEALNEMSKGCMVEHLGIEFTKIGADYIEAKMPVDHRTIQPMGLLHGGASVALAETMGSVAATLQIDMQTQAVVGVEINANHLGSVREGNVIARVTAVHIGRSTHVWNIEIKSENGKKVAVSRITIAILDKE